LLAHILGADSDEGEHADEADDLVTEFDSTPPMSTRSSGTLKSALRAFVLDVAGGYREIGLYSGQKSCQHALRE
jgi:hypothetical protein